MTTRAQLRELYPGYDNMLAIDKICLEDIHNTRAGKLRKSIERPLEAILTIGLPVGLHFLAKEGHAAPDPGFIRYSVAALAGFVVGKTLGTAIGTIVYEVTDKEGEVGQYLSRVKNYFFHHSDSWWAI